MSSSWARRARFVPQIAVGDCNFEVVRLFIYLGSSISNNNNVEGEVKKRRLILVNNVYYGLHKKFTFQPLSRETTDLLCKTSVQPVLMYDFEMWALSKNGKNMLNIL